MVDFSYSPYAEALRAQMLASATEQQKQDAAYAVSGGGLASTTLRQVMDTQNSLIRQQLPDYVYGSDLQKALILKAPASPQELLNAADTLLKTYNVGTVSFGTPTTAEQFYAAYAAKRGVSVEELMPQIRQEEYLEETPLPEKPLPDIPEPEPEFLEEPLTPPKKELPNWIMPSIGLALVGSIIFLALRKK